MAPEIVCVVRPHVLLVLQRNIILDTLLARGVLFEKLIYLCIFPKLAHTLIHRFVVFSNVDEFLTVFRCHV